MVCIQRLPRFGRIPSSFNRTAMPRYDIPSACIRRIRAMTFCSRAFSTSRPFRPKTMDALLWSRILACSTRSAAVASRGTKHQLESGTSKLIQQYLRAEKLVCRPGAACWLGHRG